MSVHSRPSKQIQDGMELRDRKMTKDCTHPLKIGNIRALNGCAVSDRIWLKCELIQAYSYMHVLVSCKNEEDPIKNEGAGVFTTFLPL